MRWCLKDPLQANKRSQLGSLADIAVKKQKRIAHESTLDPVTIEGQAIDNVYSFEYLGSCIQCDGDDRADVRYRMDIAQAHFSSLNRIWKDHRLPQSVEYPPV